MRNIKKSMIAAFSAVTNMPFVFCDPESFNDQVFITNARQKSALAAAEDALTKAMDSINMGMSEDFFTIDMMEAYTQLGLLIGETVEDDLADEIFSRFCMGK